MFYDLNTSKAYQEHILGQLDDALDLTLVISAAWSKIKASMIFQTGYSGIELSYPLEG
jgi:hypothetical protein